MTDKAYVQLNNRSDVQLGDIIFFFNALALNRHAQVSHVALCTGFTGKTPNISHAIYNPQKTLAKVITSRLRSSYSYLVYRCQNRELALSVAQLALRWSTLEIPYDFGREQLMERFLKKVPTLDAALACNSKAYLRREFLQGFKFAARNKSPIRKGSIHGFRCDQFVILCFQVADNLMTKHYYFRTIAQQQARWVSMSYFNPRRSQRFVSRNPSKCVSVPLINQLSKQITKKQPSSAKTAEQVTKMGKKTLSLATVFTSKVYESSQLLEDQALPLSPKYNCSPSVLLHYLDSFGSSGGGRQQVPGSNALFFKAGVIAQDATAVQRLRSNRIISSRSVAKTVYASGDEPWSDEQLELSVGRDRFMHKALCLALRVNKRVSRQSAEGDKRAKRARCAPG